MRASFLSLREKEFAEAARAIGNGDVRIIFRHLLPNAVAPIIVQATLDVANVIILESTLSFLGFGIQPPTASWGNMLANAQSNITIAWWAAIFPGLCIFDHGVGDQLSGRRLARRARPEHALIDRDARIQTAPARARSTRVTTGTSARARIAVAAMNPSGTGA